MSGNFKVSYVIPKDVFDEMKDIAKKRKMPENKTKKKKKPEPKKPKILKDKKYTWRQMAKMAVQEELSNWKEKNKEKKENIIKQKVFLPVKGSTPEIRQARFLKKIKGGEEFFPKNQKLITDYLKKENFSLLHRVPIEIRTKAEYLLEFIKKKIPEVIFSWDNKTLEVKILGKHIPNSNIVDIIKYFYGIGTVWGSSYNLNEIPQENRELAEKKFF